MRRNLSLAVALLVAPIAVAGTALAAPKATSLPRKLKNKPRVVANPKQRRNHR